MSRLRPWGLLLLLAACGHSAPFATTTSLNGPLTGGTDIQLTYNPDQDYWPAWTADGRGILYSFVDAGSTVQHRCLGLLPAGGGTRLWQLCDNRPGRADSVSSYTGFALDSAGRLLLVEAVSPAPIGFPLHPQLFLTDTAHPFQRTPLLTLPVTVSAGTITWLVALTWTGPNSFLALGQRFTTGPHCYRCACGPCPTDSTFASVGVVAGTIAGGAATLRAVDGTDGAVGYAVIEPGAAGSIAFVRADGELLTVPIAGGSPAAVGMVTSAAGEVPLGVTCRGTICLVADGPVGTDASGFTILTGTTTDLVRVELASGAVSPVGSFSGILATPQVSPASGDVVMETGRIFGAPSTGTAPVLGHVGTFSGANSDLHLYKALLP